MSVAKQFFRFALMLVMVASACSAHAASNNISGNNLALNNDLQSWNRFESEMIEKSRKDRIDGISYIIGGALTIVGGFVGGLQTKDPAESLTYTVFQNVGIASVGFGYFRWRIGDEDRRFYRVIKGTTQLSLAERQALISRYHESRDEAHHEERRMRAIVHGLLAATNLIAGKQEDNKKDKNAAVRNGLYFLGAINLFASIGFSFEF